MPEQNRQPIEENARIVRRVRGDEAEAEQHPLRDRITADRYLSSEDAVKLSHRGLRLKRLRPPRTA